MHTSPKKFVVYKDRANTFTVGLTQVAADGTETAVVFDTVVRAILNLPGVPLTVDTQTAPNAIDYETNGQLTFSIGDQDVPEGEYEARVTVIDGAGKSTQIIHEDDPTARMIIAFRNTSAIP